MGQKRRIFTNTETFRELYWKKRLPLADIARLLGCTISGLYLRMRQDGIPGRAPQNGPIRTPLDGELIYRLYVDQLLGAAEIGEIIGHAPDTVRRILKKMGASLRSKSEALAASIAAGRSKPIGKREQCPRWNGGKRVTKDGYIQVLSRGHVRAGSNNYVFEHILVWEDANGSVPDDYVVHHKNHDKADNRLDNLELLSRAQHIMEHRDVIEAGLKLTRNNGAR